jgi:hypothetical protein
MCDMGSYCMPTLKDFQGNDCPAVCPIMCDPRTQVKKHLIERILSIIV